ncbi:hypothetical protein ACFX10_014914 [Malus domestica]
MGPRRSTRLNVIIGAAPSLRGSTMATTTVTTPRGEIHGTATTSQAVPSKLARAQAQAVPSKAHGIKATTQASHSHASRTEQSAPVAKPAFTTKTAPTTQPAPAKQPTSVAKPAPAEQPTFMAQPTSSPLMWLSLLPWPSKQPKSIQD